MSLCTWSVFLCVGLIKPNIWSSDTAWMKRPLYSLVKEITHATTKACNCSAGNTEASYTVDPPHIRTLNCTLAVHNAYSITVFHNGGLVSSDKFGSTVLHSPPPCHTPKSFFAHEERTASCLTKWLLLIMLHWILQDGVNLFLLTRSLFILLSSCWVHHQNKCL